MGRCCNEPYVRELEEAYEIVYDMWKLRFTQNLEKAKTINKLEKLLEENGIDYGMETR